MINVMVGRDTLIFKFLLFSYYKQSQVNVPDNINHKQILKL